MADTERDYLSVSLDRVTRQMCNVGEVDPAEMNATCLSHARHLVRFLAASIAAKGEGEEAVVEAVKALHDCLLEEGRDFYQYARSQVESGRLEKTARGEP